MSSVFKFNLGRMAGQRVSELVVIRSSFGGWSCISRPRYRSALGDIIRRVREWQSVTVSCNLGVWVDAFRGLWKQQHAATGIGLLKQTEIWASGPLPKDLYPHHVTAEALRKAIGRRPDTASETWMTTGGRCPPCLSGR